MDHDSTNRQMFAVGSKFRPALAGAARITAPFWAA
jgi:hypothetical protein